MKEKLKWFIIIGVLVIVALIVVFFAIDFIHNSKLDYEIEEIKEYNYFLLTQNGKYGVIDKTGNQIIEPIYETIQIPNPSKPIFICMSSTDGNNEKLTSIVLNEKAEQILSNYQNVQAIQINTNIESTPYEKTVLSYEENGKYGLISLEGKKITPPIYDEISSINYKEGTFLVKQEEKVGAINLKGNTVIPCEYETITSDNFYSEQTKNKTTGFIVSQKKENGYRYGYINYKGRTILKTEYTELERVTEIANEKEVYFIAFKEGQAGILKNGKPILNYEYEDIEYNSLNQIFIVQRNGKKGAVNLKGEFILYPDYEDIFFGGMYLNAVKDGQSLMFDLQGNPVETTAISISATENPNYFIAIDKNDIYTIQNAQGETIIDDDYTYIEYLPGDYFIAAQNGKNGVIDSSGKTVVDFKYTSIFRISNSDLLQAEILSSKTIDLYNLNMEKLNGMTKATLKEENNYVMLANSTNFVYYDKKANKVQAQDIFPQNTLFAKQIDKKWGFVDKEGNVQVKNTYDMVTDFNSYGFAGICKKGKWGVIDKTGTIIKEPTYNINWVQPNFLGKYYLVNDWYGDTKYSSDNITVKK